MPIDSQTVPRLGGNSPAAALARPSWQQAIAWIVLAITLLVTWFAYDISRRTVSEHLEERFRFQTEDIKSAIAKRMLDQEIALRGGVGLFAGSATVDRDAWRSYVDALDIGANFPGLQGFGYARRVEPEALDAFNDGLRGEGFGDLKVHPSGSRPMYAPVTLLEPLDWRNRRAIGFDLFSEPVRRDAMRRARDTGAPAATGLVTPVQQNGRDTQRGFLLFLPVYRPGAGLDNVTERREALTGFVYSPFRMKDLMQGILGAGDTDIHFEIYDGRTAQPTSLLYRSTGPAGREHRPAEELHRSTFLEIAGRRWTLVFHGLPGYSSRAESYQPMLIGGGGLLINILVFFVISTVVRQRSRAELLASEFSDESRSQSIRNRAIVNTVRDGIVTVSTDFRIQTCNRSTSAIFGYDTSELVGRHLSILASDDTYAHLISAIDADSQEDQSLYFGLSDGMQGTRQDGSTFPMEISVTTMQVGGSGLFTVVFRDLTEQQRTDRLKSEFISVVSHELRTPLTSLLGSLSLMQSGMLGTMPDAAAKALSIANSNAKRLIKLVNDIIDQERMKSGQYSVSLEPTDVIAVVRDSVARNEAYATKRDVRINLDVFAKPSSAMADPERLAQVLDNLISNGIKFSPEGEAVDVCVLEQDDALRIEVHDLGPGIADDMKERIFEPFFQIETSNNRSNSGTGLGLAIAKTILDMHNATIRVSSQVGVGTCLWFDLQKIRPSS